MILTLLAPSTKAIHLPQNFGVIVKLILFEKDSFLDSIITTMQVTLQKLRKIDNKHFMKIRLL